MLLEKGYQVLWIDTSELLHYGLKSIQKEDLLLCLSQSGESFEVIEVLKRCSEFPRVIGLTAEMNSSLNNLCTYGIDILSGHEKAITSTKAHTATLAVMNLLTLAWSGELGQFIHAGIILEQIAEEMEDIFERAESWSRVILDHLDFIRPVDCKVIVARGPALSSAWHGNLCFSECAKELFVSYSAGQFRHGPFELAVNTMLAIVLSPQGRTDRLMQSLAHELLLRKTQVLLIGEKGMELNGMKHNFEFLPINTSHEFFAPILSVFYLQLITYYSALEKGIEPGTAEIVTKMTLKE